MLLVFFFVFFLNRTPSVLSFVCVKHDSWLSVQTLLSKVLQRMLGKL